MDDRFRQGNRSEVLAQYFLSELGIAVLVPRTEDIGIDFYCAIKRQEGHRLTFHSPFCVQVGSWKNKDYKYGGLDRHGNWKQSQVEWLFSQELPLVICEVDKKNNRIELFHTCAMWMSRYEYGKRMGVVRLAPRKNHNPIKKVRRKSKRLAGKAGDGYCYSIPLYDPIVSLKIEDLQRRPVMDRARESLRVAIEHDQINISHRHLSVPYSRWPHNEPPLTKRTKYGQIYVSSSSNSKEAKEARNDQLQSLLPFVVSLALAYKHAKLKAKAKRTVLDKLRGVIGLFKAKQVPDFVRNALPEFFTAKAKP